MKKGWALAVLTGCVGLPEVTDEGVHVRVAADPELVMCGGTVDHMDAFVALLSAELGVPPPTGEGRYTYYWLEPEGVDARTPCPFQLGACSFADEVWSTQIPHNHELVHAVAWQFGVPRPFFIEGLAVAYEGQPRGAGEYAYVPVADEVVASHSRWVDYVTAGGFVRWLIDAHGAAAFMRLYAKVPFLGSRERVTREFVDTYGESLALAGVRFDEARACEDTKPTALLVECAAPAVAWDGVRFAEYRTLACAQDDVVGPYTGDTAVVFRTISVPEAGEYAVTVIAESLYEQGVGVGLYLTSCGSCVGRTTELVTPDDGERRVTLTAGVHSLRIVGPARGDTSVGVLIERVREAPAE